MKSKATLKQIAKELGVSVSTVSKALSDSSEISESTKVKIKEFAALKNYKPNSIAKNLKNQRTNTIGVIIPNILNPFFAKVFSGIEKRALERGYNVITGISNESQKKEEQVMEMLNNGTIDGFIISLSEETQSEKKYSHIKEILNSGTPIVMFDRVADEIKCDKVIVDDLDSAFDATNHLIKIGCRKIALLSTIDNISVGKLRLEGFKKAIESKNQILDVELLIVENDINVLESKFEKLLSSKKIDAVFALNEVATTTAFRLALKKGVKIPEEINFIGFADGVWSKRLTPSLSTVSQHAPEIGKNAADLLIDRLEDKTEKEIPEYKTVVIKTELRQRESTKKF
ncbi:LacI family DNA-binding transcriptional regulator [uncultured Flavobacterium sp.]|uniref:LacI family DNA-binding transcriptional regulator n=1 Tax=uncultured Flavobacterium sp. TaxID=165435 RepID=UPI0030EED07B|tara:strand:- start:84499 stop:85527 length:1029 start_codon:yes stop_codon:yes gene_type:complete